MTKPRPTHTPTIETDPSIAELAAIGFALMFPKAFNQLAGVRPHHFSDELRAQVWEVLSGLVDIHGMGINPVLLAGEITKRALMKASDTMDFLVECQDHARNAAEPEAAGVTFASMIIDGGMRRRMRQAAGKIEELSKSPISTDEMRMDMQAEVMELLQYETSSAQQSLEQILEEELKRVGEPLVQGPPGLMTGIRKFDEIYSGFEPGDLVIFGARPSVGKAQPLDANVLTPTGFRAMGSIRVGDQVIGGDGLPCRVTGVFPQGVKPIFRVEFADGATVECCDDHLWTTTTRNERRRGAGPTTRPLREVRSSINRVDRGGANHYIPWVVPVSFAPVDAGRPIDPYLLGLWLGDGCRGTTCAMFCSAETDIQDRIAVALPESDTVSIHPDSRTKNTCTIRVRRKVRLHDHRGGGSKSDFIKHLDQLGLKRLYSYTKFIPDAYKVASPEVRLQVLRGLFDTDGSVVKRRPTIEYTTTSARLADDVQFMVRSLGGWCSRTLKETGCMYLGQWRPGRIAHRLVIAFHNGLVPVSSAKHLARWPKRTRGSGRAIVSVEEAGSKPCQCISVDNPDGLYVTDGFVVTHNTSLATQLAVEWSTKQRVPGGVWSLEMTTKKLLPRLACQISGLDGHRVKQNSLNAAEMDEHKAALVGIHKAVKDKMLTICDTRRIDGRNVPKSITDIVAEVRHWKNRIGMKWIVVDYMQRIAGVRRKGESREREVASVSSMLKQLAVEAELVVVAVSAVGRPHKDHMKRRPTMYELRESGQLEFDADYIVMLHNHHLVHQDQDKPMTRLARENAELIMAKNRNGPTGTAGVQFVPSCGRFEEYMIGTGLENNDYNFQGD